MARNLSKIKADLESYGIYDATEIVYNPSYDDLYKEEVNPDLEGYEK